MPTYDYRCSACGAQYEKREGFDAAATHTCEHCGKGEAKRMISVPAIVFKGSGFYATDSRGKDEDTAMEGAAAAKKAAAPSTTSGSDTPAPAPAPASDGGHGHSHGPGGHTH